MFNNNLRIQYIQYNYPGTLCTLYLATTTVHVHVIQASTSRRISHPTPVQIYLVHPSPTHDGNSSLLFLFWLFHLVRNDGHDTVAPLNVDIAAKSIHRTIGLWQGHHCSFFRVFKPNFTLVTKAGRHGAVLHSRKIGFHGCGIVVKGFPIVGVAGTN